MDYKSLPKTDLKSLSKQEMDSFFLKAGMPAFRARQTLHWIYERYARTINDITEFSKDLRDSLSAKAYLSNLTLLDRQRSKDHTEKFLFGLEDGESIESVVIPDKDRLTLCLSSQVGCAMGCKFCLTGKAGLKRSLKAHEIVDQVISVNRLLSPMKITNIVFMGMGEPLSNLGEVTEALLRLTAILEISKRKITVSTSGIAPKILELAARAPRVNLAISLNAATDEVRDSIMPVNKKYPLNLLLDTCRRFPLEPGRRITFEYVMLGGLNDSPGDAKRLVSMLRGLQCKVNLIPFNQYEGSEFRPPSQESLLKFQDVLSTANIPALVRKSKGQDILAACGQLKGERVPSLHLNL